MGDYYQQILIEDIKVETITTLVMLVVLIPGSILMYKSWRSNQKNAEAIFICLISVVGSVFLIVTRVNDTINTVRDINEGTYVEIHGEYYNNNYQYKHTRRSCIIIFWGDEREMNRFNMPSSSDWFRRRFERENFPAGDGVGTLVYAEHSKIAVMFIPDPGTTVVENPWYK